MIRQYETIPEVIEAIQFGENEYEIEQFGLGYIDIKYGAYNNAFPYSEAFIYSDINNHNRIPICIANTGDYIIRKKDSNGAYVFSTMREENFKHIYRMLPIESVHNTKS